MTLDTKRLAVVLEQLTGEEVPFTERLEALSHTGSSSGNEVGYSQLNELLLLSGLDRITQAFFAYLLTGEPEYEIGMAFSSLDQLEAGVLRFRKTALLAYGNVKFAFKSLSQDTDLLKADLNALKPRNVDTFRNRHDPILQINVIAPEEAYLTGYLIEGELRRRLKANTTDMEAVHLEERRQQIVQQALSNQAAYLASDHLDVYVATSMRAKHEFISISRTVQKIFQDEAVAELKLRWFDPTQAWCVNRIDKGLAEALMLKRASCTIYLAQESDTLGKDSELASTLAQGKPVIAFVPDVTDEYFREHIAALRDAESGRSEAAVLLDQLRLFEPEAAWKDAKVRDWCEREEAIDVADIRERLRARLTAHYNSRARTLMESHPLGIQVNLGTGVANGVLVVRTTQQCAQLVRGIVTGTLEFTLSEEEHYTALPESISGSISRVMTRDTMLTNTFWNFYLSPAE
jgi:hypothetical protein